MTLPTFYAYFLGMLVMGLVAFMQNVWFTAFISLAGILALHFGSLIAARIATRFVEWERTI